MLPSYKPDEMHEQIARNHFKTTALGKRQAGAHDAAIPLGAVVVAALLPPRAGMARQRAGAEPCNVRYESVREGQSAMEPVRRKGRSPCTLKAVWRVVGLLMGTVPPELLVFHSPLT